MKDLIIAVADGYQEKVMEALLPRVPLSSGTRPFSYDIIKNPLHDPGSYSDSQELLRSSIKQYRYALIIFDFEGTGVEELSNHQITSAVSGLLNSNGWMDRNAVIVIEPELENWMWIDNRNVELAIGWTRPESLYDWARVKGYLEGTATKPVRPKEVLEEALKISETSKSASIYKKIASSVSYNKCEDPALKKLINQLIEWFPPDT